MKGLGVQGSIGDMETFAVARAFRVLTVRHNHGRAATCRVCGANIPIGVGREVWLVTVKPSQGWYVFLCPACFAKVWAANLKFPTLDPAAMEKLAHGMEETGPASARELERAIRSREIERDEAEAEAEAEAD